MRKSRVALLVVLSFAIFLLLAFLILVNVPMFTIRGYEAVDGDTYSINGILSSTLYDNYLAFGRIHLEERIRELGYISNVRFTFKDSRLIAACSYKEQGIVIKGDKVAFFYDGERLYRVDVRDTSGLDKRFILLDVDDEYLYYMERYGFGSEFVYVLDSLIGFDGDRTLITRAEFSNNVGSGILNLDMESLGSVLVVEDLSKLAFLKECIDIISNEIQEERYDTIFSRRTYRLKSDGLFRVKR